MCICQEIKSCKKDFTWEGNTLRARDPLPEAYIESSHKNRIWGPHLETQGLASPGPWTTAGLKCSESLTGELQDMDLQLPKCLISSVRLYDPLWNLPH